MPLKKQDSSPKKVKKETAIETDLKPKRVCKSRKKEEIQKIQVKNSKEEKDFQIEEISTNQASRKTSRKAKEVLSANSNSKYGNKAEEILEASSPKKKKEKNILTEKTVTHSEEKMPSENELIDKKKGKAKSKLLPASPTSVAKSKEVESVKKVKEVKQRSVRTKGMPREKVEEFASEDEAVEIDGSGTAQLSTEKSKSVPKVRYSDEDLEIFRQRILEVKKETLEELNMLKERLEDLNAYDLAEEGSIYSMHMAEQGSEIFEKEKVYAQIQRINEYLKKLDEALKRIDDKTYGICRVCGILIAKERLLAVPITTLSASYKIHKKCPEDGIDRIEPIEKN
ncbi:MAG: hypothetical protein N2517_09260 [Ignavibacteria bacterium]|nr:hypothetical protein [Ignavibacteria bacterium]